MATVAVPARTVDEILNYYRGQHPGVLTNLYRLMNHGRLAGTGKLVILPVDQGFEHGPGRTFGMNTPGYDPAYHFRLAIESGCNAFAAPLGMLEVGAAEFAGQVPLILKLNNHDVLQDEVDPLGAQTASVRDALRLGCVGVGYTIYPGTKDRRMQYEQLRAIAEEAKEAGLVVVVWSYPRGGALKSEDETAVDVAAYAAQIAAQLGAHIIKVKLPTGHIALDAARKVYEKNSIPVSTLADRVQHIVESCFAGKRIVIFSGGAAKGSDAVYDEIRAIRDGGGFGSIIGRNAFQRPWDEALDFLSSIMAIYEGSEA
jgi:fructose-bisphosphate aldolase, class I